MPVSPRTIFACKTIRLHVLLGEIRQCIYVFLVQQPNGALIQYKYLNSVYFYCKTKLRHRVSGRQKNMFLHKKVFFYLQGIFSYINERDTPFLDCKHKHML